LEGRTLAKPLDAHGERLDRFELIAELASGGMATVFLARLLGVAGFQRLVAIKRLHPHLAREEEFVEMFLDEARLAARIHHPNVVPIQEVGQSDRGYYLVMDYIEGDTLARLLARSAARRASVRVDVVTRVVLDVLAGLHAAHEMVDDAGHPLAIVHRDVSPQNILVGVDGVARITDFGVARAASRLSTTRSGQLKGKLAYMAPEQARGAGVDRRADIFACGIVLWEALAVKRLFKGDGEAETLNRVLYEPIPMLRSAAPDVPVELERVTMKALERDPAARYATAQDFADDLERAARSARGISSVRDVAACVEEVIGDELEQHREAVRGWLARSEPSANSRPRPVDIPTKVEGSKPSRPPASRPSVDRLVDTISDTSDAQALLRPRGDKVSSVSSAVLGVAPEALGATSRPSRARWAIAGALLALVIGVAGVAGWRAVGQARVVDASPVSPSVSAPPTAVAPPAPSVSASSTAEVGESEDAGATMTAGAAPSPHKPPPARPKPSPGRPKPGVKPTATAVPDDISKNPYR
jgi:eukaryotic-like serine/threonine-protein kinase